MRIVIIMILLALLVMSDLHVTGEVVTAAYNRCIAHKGVKLVQKKWDDAVFYVDCQDDSVWAL